MSIKVGPERLQEITHQFLEATRIAVEENNGYTAGFTGDGIEAFFGYPNADEDAAYNAVIAAINLKDLVSSIKIVSDECLQVRIGIATGTVVMEKSSGTATGKNSFAFGASAPLAARLEAAAFPNTILIDELTAKLAGPSINTIILGETIFKGFSSPLPVLQVKDVNKKLTRFNARSEKHSIFVGREEELKRIHLAWNKTQTKAGSTICIIGEAGIGKSRLVYEFTNNCTVSSSDTFVLQCSSQHVSSPLYPWLRLIEDKCRIFPNDELVVRKEKIAFALKKLINISANELAIMYSYAYPDDKDRSENLVITPDRRSTIMKNLILKISQVISDNKPTVLVVEDIHWMDPSTESVLASLSHSSNHNSILFIYTSRTIGATDTLNKNINTIILNKLGGDNVVQLAHSLLENTNYHDITIGSLISRGGGNPLYIEELAKSMLASLNKNTSSDFDKNEPSFNSIPNTLNAILMAQLDALPQAKKTAQIAATIGREFRLSSIETIAELSMQTVEQHVKVLMDNDIIFHEKRNKEDIFIFKHALVQEAAYETQLNSKKKSTHLKIAKLLSSKKHISNADPELVAYHFEKGDNLVDAFAYLVKAGISRLENGASLESAKLLKHAGLLLEQEQVYQARRNTISERNYFLSLAKALNATEGASSERAVESYVRASEISEIVGDIDTQVHALDSQFGMIFNSGKINDSEPPARQMIDLGRLKNHKISEISGLQSMGMIEFTRGNFKAAKHFLKESVRDSEQYKYGLNSYPSLALMYLSWACYFLGNDKSAKVFCEKSVSSGRTETPYSLGVSLGNSCYYYQFSKDYSSLRKNARELVKLSGTTGQLMWENRGKFFLNWVDAITCLDHSCLQSVEKSVKQLLASGEEIDATFYLGILAEAQTKNGMTEKALNNVEQAIALAIDNGEYYYLAPLYILQGDLCSSKDINNKSFCYKAAKKLAIQQSSPKWIDTANKKLKLAKQMANDNPRV